MIDKEVLDKLRERYRDVHPLIFHRSCEKASTAGELFDILDMLPKFYPILWSERERRWVTTEDLYLLKEFVHKEE